MKGRKIDKTLELWPQKSVSKLQNKVIQVYRLETYIFPLICKKAVIDKENGIFVLYLWNSNTSNQNVKNHCCQLVKVIKLYTFLYINLIKPFKNSLNCFILRILSEQSEFCFLLIHQFFYKNDLFTIKVCYFDTG